MAKKVELYSLSDPNTNEVMYIGKAVNSLKRFSAHINYSKSRNTPLYAWINELLSLNQKPLLHILDVVDENEWEQKEIELINEYRNKSVNLLNVAKGGNQPYCSVSQRKINGKNVANQIHSNPLQKKLWGLKKDLFHCLSTFKRINDNIRHNNLLIKMQSRPDLFPRSLSISLL